MLGIMRRVGVRARRNGAAVIAAACGVVLTFSACSFPGYTFGGAAGVAGVLGGGGNGSFGGAGGWAGTIPGGGLSGIGSVSGGGEGPGGTTAGGSSGSAPLGGGGSGGSTGGVAGIGGMSGGAAGCVAQAGASAVAPAHCNNGSKDQDETGTDCGGPSCHPCFHTESCSLNSDCISGVCTEHKTCTQLIELETFPVIAARSTFTVQFKVRIDYLQPTPFALKDIAVRYYLARGDAFEPIVPTSTQAILNGITSIASETHWELGRVIADPSALADTYLEITFPTSKKQLLFNDSIEVTQSIQSAVVGGHQFDQLIHYSYLSDQAFQPNEHVTAFRSGQLIWGTPPRYTVPAQCFYAAVNFAGDAFVAASGLPFVAGSDSRVHFTGSTTHATDMPFPMPDALSLPMLQSAVNLDTTAHATLTIPNGKYWLYPYLVSADGGNLSDLAIQGQTVATFSANDGSGGPAWARIGPFSASVSAGKIDFSSPNGPLRLAGVEVYQSAQ
jgi:hypothetical protein